MQYPLIILCSFVFLLFSGTAHAQDDLSIQEKDWPKMARSIQVKIEDDYSNSKKLKLKLLKASNTELRTRYTYWLQSSESFDGLMQAIDRYHRDRISLSPMPDIDTLMAEKLELAKRIEKQAEIIFKAKRISELATAVYASKTYRLRVELEIEERNSKR